MKKNRTFPSDQRLKSGHVSDSRERTSGGPCGERGHLAADNSGAEASFPGDRKLVLRTGDLSPKEHSTGDPSGDESSGDCATHGPMQMNSEDSLEGNRAAKTVLDALESVTGLCFSMHPIEMIRRHVIGRMESRGVRSISEFARLLPEHPDEVRALADRLVIGAEGVRSSQLSLVGLEDQIIPLLFKNKPEGSPVRVWVPDCGTGAEAYFVSILLHENIRASGVARDFQIVATDAEPACISVGRRGLFSEEMSKGLAPERLTQYFTKEKSFFKITNEIRETLIFGVRETWKDLPPADVDIILLGAPKESSDNGTRLCRPELLAAGLAPSGFLLINSRKLPGSLDELFLSVNKALGVYVLREAPPLTSCENFSSSGKGVRLVKSSVEEAGLLIDELRARNRQTQQELDFTSRRLKLANDAIGAKDIALSELLGQIEQRHQQAVAAIRAQLDKTILPLMTALDEQTPRESTKLAALLRSSLQQIASPTEDRLETLHSRLSQKDLQICVMIRSGLTSKEIASLMHLSEEAIRSRRKSIRKKLGISSDKIGLDTFLRSV